MNRVSSRIEKIKSFILPAVAKGKELMSPGVEKIKSLILLLYREVLKFGVVGAIGVVIDFSLNYWALYNEQYSIFHGSEVKAKIFSGVVAALFSWFANRYWTFKNRQTDKPWREFILFMTMNGIGILIAAACVWFSKYILGLDSPQASLIAGQVVGLGLGTIFRFVTYRYLVFKQELDNDDAFTQELDDGLNLENNDEDILELHPK